jgi:hypothetical protein
MNRLLLCVGIAFTTMSGIAQAAGCITAGRIDEQGRWAPRMGGVELIDAQGRAVSGPRASLEAIKAVRILADAPFSMCQGNAGPLARTDTSPGAREPSQHVRAGVAPLNVQAVFTPSLRAGARLVELQVAAPTERIVLQ